jgi:hypothetical protein
MSIVDQIKDINRSLDVTVSRADNDEIVIMVTARNSETGNSATLLLTPADREDLPRFCGTVLAKLKSADQRTRDNRRATRYHDH